MGWLEGLIGGFSARKSEIEAQNLEEARLAQQREGRIFEALLSSPDPEIQSMAVAGLLDSANPKKRKGGLRGWMGEMEQSPYLPRIQELINTPVPVTKETIPSTQISQGIPLAPGSQPAAMPQSNAVQPGGAPPTPTAAVQTTPAGGPPPTPLSLTNRPPTPYVAGSRPRQVFPPYRSPEEQALLTRRAQSQGDVEGEVAGLIAAGFSDAEARELVKQDYLRRATSSAGSVQALQGTLPNGSLAYGILDRRPGSPTFGRFVSADTGEPLIGFQPRATTGSASMGTEREALSREMFGKRAADLTPAEMQQVNDRLPQEARELSLERGRGTGQAQIETELQSPIGITAGAEQGVSPTTPLSAFDGIVPVTTEQRGRLEAAKALAVPVDNIRTLVSQVFPNASGLIGGLTATIVLNQKRASRDPQLAQLEAQINLALGNVARVLAAESGRLTEQDAQRARTALADLQGFTDTRESALAKVAIIQQALDRIAADVRLPADQLQQPRPTPPAAGGGGGSPLDQPVAGWFVDANGNLVQR